LQAPERVSNVRIQGREVYGQSVEQSLGGHAAKSVSGDEGCFVAAIRKRRPQLSRQPVAFKREGDVWIAKEPFVETPNGTKPGFPPTRREALRHWRGRHLPNTTAWSRGFE